MAMAGRKPKPTALKVLEGDRGKGRRPLNEHEPVPPKGGVKCPSWLLPEAKKEWKRLAASLEAMGVLTMADLTAFAGYCQAYARWREAEDFITQHGSIFKTPSGYVQQVPQVSIAQQNLKIMQSFATEFGLTPACRARIVASGSAGAYGVFFVFQTSQNEKSSAAIATEDVSFKSIQLFNQYSFSKHTLQRFLQKAMPNAVMFSLPSLRRCSSYRLLLICSIAASQALSIPDRVGEYFTSITMPASGSSGSMRISLKPSPDSALDKIDQVGSLRRSPSSRPW